jgi:hypothetical protein
LVAVACAPFRRRDGVAASVSPSNPEYVHVGAQTLDPALLAHEKGTSWTLYVLAIGRRGNSVGNRNREGLLMRVAVLADIHGNLLKALTGTW